MEKIWIVFGTTGEYSDRGEWVVDAWRSEEEAKAKVELLKQKYQEFGCERVRRDYGSEARTAAFTAMEEFDPSFSCDYTGTEWYIVEADLHPSRDGDTQHGD